MSAAIPEGVRDLFDEPAVGHVSYMNRRGRIVTFPRWVDFDGEHILISSPAERRTPREVFTIEIDRVSSSAAWG